MSTVRQIDAAAVPAGQDSLPLDWLNLALADLLRRGVQDSGAREGLIHATGFNDIRVRSHRSPGESPAESVEMLPPLVHRDGSRRSIGSEFSTLHQARAAYERDYILKKLDDNHGNISRTAEVLGLERSHLYRKMKTLGIAVKE